MVDPDAQLIVDTVLRLRSTHPAAAALQVLDLAMEGRAGCRLSFGGLEVDNMLPPAPFSLVLRDAFDQSISVAEVEGGIGWFSHATAARWQAVIDRFAERYQISLS